MKVVEFALGEFLAVSRLVQLVFEFGEFFLLWPITGKKSDRDAKENHGNKNPIRCPDDTSLRFQTPYIAFRIFRPWGHVLPFPYTSLDILPIKEIKKSGFFVATWARSSMIITRMKLLRRLRKPMMIVATLLAMPLLLLASCQHKLIYFPRAYDAAHVSRWQQLTKGKVLQFTTSAGKQQAYLFGPQTGKTPERLWLVCGGNATLATDWTIFLKQEAPPQDAYLLIDYPGYGENEGSPNPKKIRENITAALPMAAATWNWDEASMKKNTRFFGHSLGCAAALLGAEQFGLDRGVILSPFTSTMDMTEEVVGANVGFLLWHRFDNRAILTELGKQPGARVEIFHGALDNVVPANMGQQLQQLHPAAFTLHLIDGAGHADITEKARDAVINAMNRVR